jgi:hypothetical protein
MKLDEEYPKAFSHFTTPDGFMKGSGRPEECAWCEQPSTWFHKSCGLYFCSRHCYAMHEAADASEEE